MIVGQMALCRFPMWKECLESLREQVDELHLRFDMRKGDPEIIEELVKMDVSVFYSDSIWNNWNWREEMLRTLDRVQPELVLALDEDEKITLEIIEDIQNFKKSKYQQMAFMYKHPMPSIDGYLHRENKPYPSKEHVKLYKWRSGLTFHPYKGRARLSNYGKNDYCIGKAEILHYCFYNEEIRKMKLKGTKGKRKWSKEK